jgi:hypothetical protein
LWAGCFVALALNYLIADHLIVLPLSWIIALLALLYSLVLANFVGDSSRTRASRAANQRALPSACKCANHSSAGCCAADDFSSSVFAVILFGLPTFGAFVFCLSDL